MKLNQATAAAAFLSVSTATLASSSAASSSSYDELNDKIVSLLASKPKHLYRMLQELSDECNADIEAPFPTLENAVDECASAQSEFTMAMGADDTLSMNGQTNFSACDSSLTEACTADKGTIVASIDMGMECTFMGQSLQHQYVVEGSPMCIPTSCVSDIPIDQSFEQWAASEADILAKEIESTLSEVLAAEGLDSVDLVCKVNNFSIDGSSVAGGSSSAGGAITGAGAAGEGSAAGSSSAGEATTVAGAAESLAAGSGAGKATGMLALAATSAAAALFIF